MTTSAHALPHHLRVHESRSQQPTHKIVKSYPAAHPICDDYRKWQPRMPRAAPLPKVPRCSSGSTASGPPLSGPALQAADRHLVTKPRSRTP